ncbi:MAG: thiamine-binding protein [Prolixibacteraceae bacterium]
MTTTMKIWKKNKINVAVQVLPEAGEKIKYELVDAAIEAIKQTGLKHQVCPFETVVECNYDELSMLLESVHTACRKAGTEKMLTNLKIQVNFTEDVAIEDKMEKYR